MHTDILCLYYHIHECLGYCSKDLNKQDLERMEKEILSFLNGNDKILVNRLEEKMKEYSSTKASNSLPATI